MKKDFIPRRNANLHTFTGHFIEQLVKHNEDLSLNPEEVKEVKKILERHRKFFSKMVSLRAEAKSATEEFNISRKKTVSLLRRISQQIKTSKKYSKSIGEEFGIINHYLPVTDFSENKPVLKAMISGNYVIIKFTKKGADAIRLYSKRGDETKFSELATAFKVSYTDKRRKLSTSIPEVREYFARYVVKDKLTGLDSDVIKVIVP